MTKKNKKGIALSISKIDEGKTSIQNRTGNDTIVLNIESDSEKSSKKLHGPNGGLDLCGMLNINAIKKDEKQDTKSEKEDI